MRAVVSSASARTVVACVCLIAASLLPTASDAANVAETGFGRRALRDARKPLDALIGLNMRDLPSYVEMRILANDAAGRESDCVPNRTLVMVASDHLDYPIFVAQIKSVVNTPCFMRRFVLVALDGFTYAKCRDELLKNGVPLTCARMVSAPSADADKKVGRVQPRTRV